MQQVLVFLVLRGRPIECKNDIRNFRGKESLAALAESYPHLWEDRGQRARILEEQLMTVPLKQEVKPNPAKVYLLGREDREFVDQEFNKLHEQGRLEWTTEPTPHSYPVFVVWRTIHKPNGEKERKGRVVIDIRGLNRDTVPDTYPMPLQADILAAVQGCDDTQDQVDRCPDPNEVQRVALLFMPETYAPILLKWKASHMRGITGDARYLSLLEIQDVKLTDRLLHNIYRPFVLFAFEPIAVLFTLYLTVVYVVLFFLTGYEFIISSSASGLAFSERQPWFPKCLSGTSASWPRCNNRILPPIL